jgi:pimeloyl-ACP methyl ester carboxylesterase
MLNAKQNSIIFMFLLLLGTLSSKSQEHKVIHKQVIQFSLKSKNDSINFVVVDTSLQQKKPVFLWCQGSLPIPLFAELEEYGYIFLGGGVSNFDYKTIVKKFHLVIISMPKTPVSVDKEHLNRSMQYIPNPEQPHNFSKAFYEADFLENYVERGQAVLKFLKKQKWVDRKQLVIAGHSQGSKVATKIAVNHSEVTHLGLFGANPFGRIDQMIREARLKAELGKISQAKADSIIKDQYDFFRYVQDDSARKEDPSLKAWKSFEQMFYRDWLKLEIPIYLAYGTADRTSDLCDLIPLYFIAAGKENLTMKRYWGWEHNFFEVSKDGAINYEKAHWAEVMNTFLNWIK